MTSRTDGKPLLTVSLSRETDFLLARRRAAQIAALLRMEGQDRTRIATAVSEIARNAFLYGGGGRARYFVERAPRLAMRIVIEDSGPGIPHLESIWRGTYDSHSGMGLGLIGAKRLSDDFNIESSDQGTRVTLVKFAGRDAATNAPSDHEIASALAGSEPAGAMSTLVDQNQELMLILEQLRTRETELERLNQELVETNLGVMALYSELEDKAGALQQANEIKSRFLSTVTHELRTPLNSIVSLSRLLLNGMDGELNAEQQKQVGFVLRSAQTMTDMVNDLLDLGKIEAGKVALRRTLVSVNDVFAALRGMFRPLEINEEVKLRLEIPVPPIELTTDEGKLAQILRNLISNALKFTERGEVVVRAWREGSSICFSVSDTGVGIAPEHREWVMQEWAQVEGLSSSRHRGSGLGLPLSKKFAELLDGEMWFDSVLGEGSQFYVRLPVGQRFTLEERTPASRDAGPSVIAVIDDDEITRYLIRRRLASMTTARIVEANHGKEGLALIHSEKPALVFLDLFMPELTGFEVAKAVRADSDTSATTLVAVTAKELTREERQLLEDLDVEVIAMKHPTSEENRMYFERVLLQVGLNNINQLEA